MRLTRLEIFGFKSFVDRFVLNFDEPMIGVVGPNGCGKSNIVDALRWVLGETHAKQLRGGVLEDLIFSGSETKRPLGLAEVSITIQPREGWSELTTPNFALAAPGTVAGLSGEEGVDEFKSVEEILSEADQELASDGIDPASTENAIEEDHTPSILRDIPGLLNCAEVQFTRRLYRSGESEYFINKIPCRLRDMMELYRLMGLGARGLSIVQQGQISELITKKPIERRELLEDAAGISGFRARLETAERKLEKTVDNTKKIELLIVEIEKNVKFLERQAKRARDRQKLKDQIREHELDHYLFSASQMKADAERDLSKQLEILERLDALKASLSGIEAQRTEVEAQISTIDHDLIAKRRERDDVAMRLTSERDRLNEIKLRRAVLSEKLDGLGRALQEIASKKIEVSTFQEKVVGREIQFAEKLRVETDLYQKAEQFLKEHEDAKIAAQSQLATMQQEFLFGNSGRIGALEEELQQLPILREKIAAARSDLDKKQGELNGAQSERSKIELALARAESELESITRNFSSFVGKIADWLIVNNFSEVLRAGTDHSMLANLKIATKSGEEISKWEWQVPTSELQATVDSIIDSYKPISALEQSVAEIKSRLEQADRTILDLANNVTTVQLSYDSAQQELTELTRKQDELVRLRKEEQREANEHRRRLLIDQQKKQEELLVVERDLQRELRRIGDNVATIRSEYNQLERHRQEYVQQIEELNTREATLSEQISQIRDEIATIDATMNTGVDTSSRLISELELTIATSAESIRQLERSREPLQLRMGELSQTLYEQEREAKKLEQELHAIDLRIQRLNLELENLQQMLLTNNPDVDLNELNIKVSAVDLCDAAESAERSREQAQRLRQRIEREGDVDPSSIDQFEGESVRLASLKAQREDLAEATKTLERTIKQLKEVSRRRLNATFEAVSQKFEELVPRLFGGGSGQLRLINPEDPLTSGVEILVRPPGKRIVKLELLSGGEKGLVAVCLLVALFLHKPSPVCVLDEVDAPFDEANLQRFLDMLDEISTTTQFLVVTHNRITMERVGKLIGITMQEKGVSKAFTLDLTAPEADKFGIPAQA
jgi:chromosome segregation protein